jgi:hypothetical protein
METAQGNSKPRPVIPAARVDVVGVIGNLLGAEHMGAVHFLAASDPYLGRADAGLRRMLQGIMQTSLRHEGELAMLLEDLGATPRLPRVNAEHQYMAFLSTDYLLPKVRQDKARSTAEYERAVALLEGGNEAVVGTLLSHLDDHRRDLAELDRVIAARSGSAARANSSRL